MSTCQPLIHCDIAGQCSHVINESSGPAGALYIMFPRPSQGQSQSYYRDNPRTMLEYSQGQSCANVISALYSFREPLR